MARLECYRDNSGTFAWRLLSGNHRTMAMSPGPFDTLPQAVAAARRFQSAAAEATVQYRRGRGDEWVWQMRHAGDVLAVSPHPYGRRFECIAAADRARDAAPLATLRERGAAARSRRPRPPDGTDHGPTLRRR